MMIDKPKQIASIQDIYQKQGNKQTSNISRTFDQILNSPINQEIEDTKQTPITQQSQKDYYKEIMQFVFKHEGKTLVKDDGGRESSRYGILASTAKQYGYDGELSEMTKSDAEKIYKKLWDKSGAEKLPYPLSLIHFDTYVNSPAAAKRILEKSQGDMNTYLDLREQRYNRLVELKPERYAKYIKGWKNRINNLRALAEEHRQQVSIASNKLMISNLIPNIIPLSDSKKPLL
ncbi:MAG: hypothetical protein N2738_08685 [Thermodesulfovibrionales bacterium]|nr:hypothetical protein [Thermodesulfovibrionales bacterium]